MSPPPPLGSRVFDMGELVTLTSRPVVAQAVGRGCAYRFDYVGSPTDIRGDADAHQRCFQRVLAAAADLLLQGTLNIFGRSEQVKGRDQVAVTLTLVVTGELADATSARAVMERLSILPDPSGRSSHATCPFIGADIAVSAPSRSQVLLQVKFDADGRVRQAPAPYAHGASAFLVHPDHEAAEGLAGCSCFAAARRCAPVPVRSNRMTSEGGCTSPAWTTSAASVSLVRSVVSHPSRRSRPASPSAASWSGWMRNAEAPCA